MDFTFRNEKRTIGFCLFLIGLSLWLPEGVFKTGLCSYLKDWCFHNTLKFRQGLYIAWRSPS